MHIFEFSEMLNAKVVASLAASSFLITAATNQTFTAGREARSLFLPFFDFFLCILPLFLGRWLKIEDGTYIHELSISDVIADEGGGEGSIQLASILQDNGGLTMAKVQLGLNCPWLIVLLSCWRFSSQSQFSS